MKPKAYDAKPDWPQAAENWERFWRGEFRDRPIMVIHSPRKRNPYPKPARPEDLMEFHRNLDFVLARRLHEIYRLEYHAEAFPSFNLSITAGLLDILLGARLRALNDGIIYAEPFIKDWNAVADIGLVDRRNEWFELCQRQMDLFKEHADKAMIQVPDFHGFSDALVAIRGACELALDLYDCPDKIPWTCGRIFEAWKQAYMWYYDEVKAIQHGTCIWFRCCHPGRIEALQEDFTENISIEDYQTHFQPWVERMSAYVDAALHHLHNTMFRHQMHVANMQHVKGCQFRPPYVSGFMPERVARRAKELYTLTAAGKIAVFSALDEDDMIDAIRAAVPGRLIILMDARDADDARRLTEVACEHTDKRRKELGL